MALLLRTVRQNRWFREDAAPWLSRGDVPADPVGDLRTTRNQLSVWEMEPDLSNLERVVRAVAVGKQKIADQGYVLFDSELLNAVGVASEAEAGNTDDKQANSWHRNLVELSGKKLVALTKTILENGKTGTVLKKRLRELVEAGIREKQLPEKHRSKCS